jgi:hypothetical protein
MYHGTKIQVYGPVTDVAQYLVKEKFRVHTKFM